MKKILFSMMIAFAAAACGPKNMHSAIGKGTGDVPPPPDIHNKDGGSKPTKPPVSEDARKDFQNAADFFAAQEKAGWNENACRSSADKFAAVVREHKMVEAQYMVGRSYHACNMLKEAEEAYQAALAIDSNHAPSISNLGELYYQDGKVDGARKYWEAAVKADPKVTAARANLAMLDIEQLRTMGKGDAWTKLEKEARDHLSSVLAVDNDNYKAYVLYGMLYMEGRQWNKNRLDLAKLLLDEGAKRKADYAPLEHAYGLYYLYKDQLTEALAHFQKAIDLDDKFAEAHMNVALITLGFRKYDVAKDNFQKVLDLKSGKYYDALIGIGVAERGLGDLDGAEAAYNKAKDLDAKRADSYFNLGVLYKDFRAAKQDDLKKSQDAYKTARDYFKQSADKDGLSDDDKQEAKDNIGDCDKVIKQLDDFMKAQASMPQGTSDDSGSDTGSDAGSGSGTATGSGSGSAAGSGSGTGSGSGK